MTPVRRALALLVLPAAFLAVAIAQEPADESGSTSISNESRQPSIHGRTAAAAQDDLGQPPKSVSKPPLDTSALSPADCASLPQAVAAYMDYEKAKPLWNLRKIASLGNSYSVAACKEADEAFEKAADLSGDESKSKAFQAAANDAFVRASSCRQAFDQLYWSCQISRCKFLSMGSPLYA